jgi:intracellular septation protein
VPILLASIAILWKLTGKISRIQVFTAVMVVVFGGLTVWLNDERFFKMKTTLVYGFFATMLGIGLLRGQSWLQFLMGDLLPMRQEGWMIMTRRIAGAFALMAVLNEVVWRTQSTEFWVTFETFGLPAFLFVGVHEPGAPDRALFDRAPRRLRGGGPRGGPDRTDRP